MSYIILKIVLDVVVIWYPVPCEPWMRDYLPYPPKGLVHLERGINTDGCRIHYRREDKDNE